MEGRPFLGSGGAPIGSLSANSPLDLVNLLIAHGCPDLTPSIDLGASNNYPFAGGGFCDVYRGYNSDGIKLAIKSLKLYERPGRNKEKEKILKDVAVELLNWSRLKHSNVVPLMGLAVFRGHISMVSAWMDNRDLISYIDSNPSVDRMDLCIDICAGILYIHENNLIHGDLKAANVLISCDGSAMIADFGNSQLRDLTLKFTNATSTRFSVRWTAPEIFQVGGALITQKLDVYAYGMTVLEALTGKPPFDQFHEHQVLLMVAFERQSPGRPTNRMSDEIWEILQDCWRWEHSERPDIAAVGKRLLDLLARFIASTGSIDDIGVDLQKVNHQGAPRSPLDNDPETGPVERSGELNQEQEVDRIRQRLTHIELLHKKLLSARKRLLRLDHPDILESVKILERLSFYRAKLAEKELIKAKSPADREQALGDPLTMTKNIDLPAPTPSPVPKLVDRGRRSSWPLCGNSDRTNRVGPGLGEIESPPQAAPKALEGYAASERTPVRDAPGLLGDLGGTPSPPETREPTGALETSTGAFQVLAEDSSTTQAAPGPRPVPRPVTQIRIGPEDHRETRNRVGRIGTQTTIIPILPLPQSMSHPISTIGQRDGGNPTSGQVNRVEANRSPTRGSFASPPPTGGFHWGFKPQGNL